MSSESNELHLNNEAGKKREGNPSCEEYTTAREFPEAGNSQRVFEFPEEKATTRKPPPKVTVLQRILVAAVAVVAVAVYDLVGIMPQSGAKVREYSIEAHETGVFYWIEFDDYTSGDDLSVEVYNDFVRHSQTVEDRFVSGEVYDLKPGMTYTVEVWSGNSVLLRKKVTTLLSKPIEEEPYEEPIEEPVTEPTEPEQTAEPEESTKENQNTATTGQPSDQQPETEQGQPSDQQPETESGDNGNNGTGANDPTYGSGQ